MAGVQRRQRAGFVGAAIDVGPSILAAVGGAIGGGTALTFLSPFGKDTSDEPTFDPSLRIQQQKASDTPLSEKILRDDAIFTVTSFTAPSNASSSASISANPSLSTSSDTIPSPPTSQNSSSPPLRSGVASTISLNDVAGFLGGANVNSETATALGLVLLHRYGPSLLTRIPGFKSTKMKGLINVAASFIPQFATANPQFYLLDRYLNLAEEGYKYASGWEDAVVVDLRAQLQLAKDESIGLRKLLDDANLDHGLILARKIDDYLLDVEKLEQNHKLEKDDLTTRLRNEIASRLESQQKAAALYQQVQREKDEALSEITSLKRGAQSQNDEIVSLRKENATLAHKNDSLRLCLQTEKEGREADLTNHRAQLVSKDSKYENASLQFQSQLEASQMEICALKCEAEKLRSANAALECKVNASTTQIEQLEADRKKEKTMSSLEVEKLQAKLETTQQKLTDEIARSTKSRQTLEEERTARKQEAEAKDKDDEVSRQLLDSKDSELAEAKNEQDTLRTKLEKASAEHEKDQTCFTAKTKSLISDAERLLEDNQRLSNDLRSSFEKHEISLGTVVKQHEDVLAQIQQRHKTEVADLSSKIRDTQKEAEALKTEVDESKAEITKVRLENKDLEGEYKKLKAEYGKLQGDYAGALKENGPKSHGKAALEAQSFSPGHFNMPDLSPVVFHPSRQLQEAQDQARQHQNLETHRQSVDALLLKFTKLFKEIHQLKAFQSKKQQANQIDKRRNLVSFTPEESWQLGQRLDDETKLLKAVLSNIFAPIIGLKTASYFRDVIEGFSHFSKAAAEDLAYSHVEYKETRDKRNVLTGPQWHEILDTLKKRKEEFLRDQSIPKEAFSQLQLVPVTNSRTKKPGEVTKPEVTEPDFTNLPSSQELSQYVSTDRPTLFTDILGHLGVPAKTIAAKEVSKRLEEVAHKKRERKTGNLIFTLKAAAGVDVKETSDKTAKIY